MEIIDLTKEIKKVKISNEMKERIIKNCNLELEEKNMMYEKTKEDKRSFIKRPVAIAASMIVCLFLTGVTALAASGQLQGFFKDIKRWDGAVVGTSYEQATEEMEVSIAKVNEKLTLTVRIMHPEKAPYAFLDTFGIGQYKIMDATGKTLIKDGKTEMLALTDDEMTFMIPLEDCPSGKYQLVVESFVGAAKADQPLEIRGIWTCDFVR